MKKEDVDKDVAEFKVLMAKPIIEEEAPAPPSPPEEPPGEVLPPALGAPCLHPLIRDFILDMVKGLPVCEEVTP